MLRQWSPHAQVTAPCRRIGGIPTPTKEPNRLARTAASSAHTGSIGRRSRPYVRGGTARPLCGQNQATILATSTECTPEKNTGSLSRSVSIRRLGGRVTHVCRPGVVLGRLVDTQPRWSFLRSTPTVCSPGRLPPQDSGCEQFGATVPAEPTASRG